MRLFGFQIIKNKPTEEQNLKYLPSENIDDDAIDIGAGFYGFGINFDNINSENESQLITRYRDLSLQPEIDQAINDIVDEFFAYDQNSLPVKINFDQVNDAFLSQKVRKQIEKEFEYLLDLMNFRTNAYEIFRRWYVDGRLYYQKIIDQKAPEQGILDLSYIDPRNIKKVRQDTTINQKASVFKPEQIEYYIYTTQKQNNNAIQQIQLTADSIAYINSGIYDSQSKIILSHLHKAIKPFNQLRMMEDALVIYRIARAPERRIFNIEVGRLPRAKAEQYVQETMNKFKREIRYDATTGELKDDRRFMSMVEDFWFPKIEGKGTTIDNLPGGQNLGELTDVEFFKDKFYKSLNLPASRYNQQTGSMFDPKAMQINRDELKFMKFIARLRKRFSLLFDDILKSHLVLKGIITLEEWESISKDIVYDFIEDNYFTEVRDQQVWGDKIAVWQSSQELIAAKQVSKAWVRRNIMKISDIEFEEMIAEIETETQDDINNAMQNNEIQQIVNQQNTEVDSLDSQAQQPNDKPKQQNENNELNSEGELLENYLIQLNKKLFTND